MPACYLANGSGLGLGNCGGITVKRNVFKDTPSRPINLAVCDGATTDVEQNYVEGCGTGSWQGHGECTTFFATGPNGTGFLNFKYNTLVIKATYSFAGFTTPIFATDGTLPGTKYGAMVFDHNVIVSNVLCPGNGAADHGSFTGTIDNGSGTGVGATLTVTSITGAFPICLGSNIGATGFFGYVMKNISGSGVGSKWEVSCYEPAAPNGGSCTPGVAKATDPTHSYIDIPNIQLSAQSMTYDNRVNSAPCLVTKGNYVSITITNNLCDVTSAQIRYDYEAATNSLCDAATVFSGNKNLLDGTSMDAWVVNNSGSNGNGTGTKPC
jgi:hypothetical protein